VRLVYNYQFKAECKVVFTANQGVRGGKIIELKKTVDAAVEKSPSVKNVFVYKRTDNVFNLNKERDVVMDDVNIILDNIRNSIILLYEL